MGLYSEIPPRYADGWLGDIVPSVLAALKAPGFPDRRGRAEGVAGIQQVAFLMIDGLGWHKLHAGVPTPTLSTFVE